MSRTSFKLCGLSSTIRISSFATTHRDRERERGAHAHLALHPDPPAVQLDELPTQGQSQPGALDLLVRRPHLAELLEHRLLILRGDAHPRIADRHLDHAVLSCGPDVNAPALRGELDGIRQQIEDDLAYL